MFKYWHNSKGYLIHGHDYCCFAYAVANCNIYCGKWVDEFQLFTACKLGKTDQQSVIDFLKAPLKKIDKAVFEKGGIIHIIHPIYGRRAVFIAPEDQHILLINSWLGPPVAKMKIIEIEPYIDKEGFWEIV